MFKVKKSGAKYSAIVGIGESLRQKSLDENKEYLFLNRGVNAVVNIDINELAKGIDFNSDEIQVYPPVKGRPKLRAAINSAFFHNSASIDKIFITNGGVSALDLIFKTLDVSEVVLPPLYWGAYLNVLKINALPFSFYDSISGLAENKDSLKGKAVIICDPNNPSGAKIEDKILLETISKLDEAGVVVIVDSPYRRLFYDWETDDYYKNLTKFEHVIVSESFSKSVGLSGQRIGFVYCNNEDFMHELSIKLLYATNGINNFSQMLVEKILTEDIGIKAAKSFRKETVLAIEKNIDYLIENQLIADKFYGEQKPWGIFVIIKKTHEELLKNHIGSVPLTFFCQLDSVEANKYSRICVSVPHKKFKGFFDKIS